MNVKLVLKTYSILRQLTDNESALLETLRAMNETERELLVETLGPQKSSKKSPSKSSALKAAKSPRASEIASNIVKNLRRVRETGGISPIDDDDDSGLCIVGLDSSGMTCGEAADHNVHHLTTHPDYHEFSVGKHGAASVAHPSSANGGTEAITASIATDKAGAGVAVGGSSNE